jgi:hypothetical protein
LKRKNIILLNNKLLDEKLKGKGHPGGALGPGIVEVAANQ